MPAGLREFTIGSWLPAMAEPLQTTADNEWRNDSLLVMVIEKFKGGQAAQVYTRLRKRGRMLPEGVRYVCSWVDMEFTRCFQLMECADTAHLTPWIEQWADLVDFELVPVRAG